MVPLLCEVQAWLQIHESLCLVGPSSHSLGSCLPSISIVPKRMDVPCSARLSHCREGHLDSLLEPLGGQMVILGIIVGFCHIVHILGHMEIATKAVLRSSNSREHVILLDLLCDGHGITRKGQDVVHMGGHTFMMVFLWMHPQVNVSLTQLGGGTVPAT